MMDSMRAFMRGQEAMRAGNKMMVFDWDKAATLIREQGAQAASAGLRDDWEWTGGPIFRDCKPIPADDTYVYLSSSWAVPEIDIDGVIHECWKYVEDTADWDAKTYWPSSALAILGHRSKP